MDSGNLKFIRKVFPLLGLLFLAAGPLSAEEKVPFEKTVFIFADRGTASTILGTADPYIERLSSFDRSSRKKTEKDVSKEEFLNFAAGQTLDWNDQEKLLLQKQIDRIRKDISVYPIQWPNKIYLIKTTGEEEGDCPYTRGNAVIFPKGIFRQMSGQELERTFIHELFHILSRYNPELRKELYALLGFAPCPELVLPEKLNRLKITNPDACYMNYYFTVERSGNRLMMIPVLFSSSWYNEAQGGIFLDYLGLFLVSVRINGDRTEVIKDRRGYHIYPYMKIPEYKDLIFKNSDYIIHPEEILADNFVLLFRKPEKDEINAPELLEEMNALFRQADTFY